MRVQNANGVRKNRTSTWTIRCQVTGNTFISRLQVLFWDTSTVVITRLSSRDFLGFSRSRFVCTGLIRLAVTLRYKAESTRTASHESQCVLGYLHIHTTPHSPTTVVTTIQQNAVACEIEMLLYCTYGTIIYWSPWPTADFIGRIQEDVYERAKGWIQKCCKIALDTARALRLQEAVYSSRCDWCTIRRLHMKTIFWLPFLANKMKPE